MAAGVLYSQPASLLGRYLAGSVAIVGINPAKNICGGETMPISRPRKWAAAAVLSLGLAAGFGPAAMASDTVKIGMSTALSGSIAVLGRTTMHGVQLAIDKINANGGVLGKQIELLTADGEAKPSTGVTNVRNFILSDQVKALIGPVSSAVGSAEASVAGQYQVP